jgi:hypothetical protein
MEAIIEAIPDLMWSEFRWYFLQLLF